MEFDCGKIREKIKSTRLRGKEDPGKWRSPMAENGLREEGQPKGRMAVRSDKGSCTLLPLTN